MLLRPGHQLSNSGEPNVNLLTVGSRPIDPATDAAAAESFGGFEHIWWDDGGYIIRRHIIEDPVAIAAARPFEILGRREPVAVENFGELSLEALGSDHLGFRSRRRELVVAGEQPAILALRNSGQLRILRFGPEVEAVIAAQPKPASERTEHRVAEKAGGGRGLSHVASRIAWNGGREEHVADHATGARVSLHRRFNAKAQRR